MPAEHDAEATRQWALGFLEKAQGDVQMALAAVERQQAPGWGIAFHCQQAVEKVLKGALALHGVAPPKTHDLGLLRDLCLTYGIELPVGDGELQALFPFAIRSRCQALADCCRANCRSSRRCTRR